MMRNRWAYSFLLFLLVHAGSVNAAPLGTAFSYQGRLDQAGAPVTGTVDLTARLFDASTGGRQVGPTLNLNGVAVTDGLFEVALDFGDFGDLALWLELEVNKTVLSPRQPLRPTPVALHALSVETVEAGSLSGTYPNPLQFTNPANQFTGSGANLNSLSAANIVSGTLPDARLSSNVARRNTTNTFAQDNYFSGAVGIGTTIPEGSLDVRGSITSQHPSGNNDNFILKKTGPAGPANVEFKFSHRSNGTEAWMYANNGTIFRNMQSWDYANNRVRFSATGSTLVVDMANARVGMGVLSPSRKLHVADGNASILLEGLSGTSAFLRFVRTGVDADDDQNYIALSSANGSLVTRVGGQDRTRILQNGNVGINTNNPATTLHVSGAIRADNGAPGSTYSTLEGDRLSSSTTFTVDGGFDLVLNANRHAIIEPDDDVLVRAGRNVDIEIPLDGEITAGRDLDISASAILDLSGTSQVRLSSSGPLILNTSGLVANGSRVGINSSSPVATLQVDGASGEDALRVRVSGTTRLLVSDTGGLSGGTVIGGNTDPQYQLHVAGNGSAGKPGGGLWSATSDRRLKKNVEPLTNALDQLLALNGVTFEYIDPESINEDPGTHMGLIAQEVEEIFPDWVHEAPDGYLRVSEKGTTALFVEAIRELREEKDAEIARLRARNEQLERRLEALERAFIAGPVSLP